MGTTIHSNMAAFARKALTMKFVLQMALVSLLAVACGCFLAAIEGCQSTKNITNIYVQDNSTATITADGGSNAKPISLKDVSATVPMGM